MSAFRVFFFDYFSSSEIACDVLQKIPETGQIIQVERWNDNEVPIYCTYMIVSVDSTENCMVTGFEEPIDFISCWCWMFDDRWYERFCPFDPSEIAVPRWLRRQIQESKRRNNFMKFVPV